MTETPDDKVPWGELTGGYRTRYDPRPALEAVRTDSAMWEVLWEQLHHQRDVGTASYAALPFLARLASESSAPNWNPFALAATIEEVRHEGDNPDMPPWLAADYAAAWQSLFETALAVIAGTEDELLIRSLLAVLAIYKKQPLLGRLALLTESERSELIEEVGWA